jgi:periplasmic copper chaperone A
MTYFLRALAVGLAAALSSAVSAHEYSNGAITVSHPWARATAPGATTGAGYLKIVNKGATPVRFLGAKTDVATTVEIHTMSMDGGVMRMRPVTGGLVIPAHGEVALKPGANHLMLIGLKRPLVEENLESMTLLFDGGVSMNVEFYVESMSAPGGEHHDH